MSVESLAIVLHHSRARGTAKLVLVGIANHDGDGGAFPKIATLAKYANVHPRRVMEALKALGELGEIIIHQNDGGTARTPEHVRPNLYELVLECPPECDRTKNHRIDGEKLGRAYKGQYDPSHTKDPAIVARAQAARERHLAELEAIKTVSLPPSDGNVTGDGNVTTPSDGNVTTKNHQVEPPRENSFVGTSPGRRPAVDNSEAIDLEAVIKLREESRARLAKRGLIITAPISQGSTK